MKLTVLMATFCFASPSVLLAQDGASIAAAVNSITPADVKARISLLAADSMRGRATPSPELEEVATYIAGEFRRFGLKPGGEGGFLQRYTVEQVQLDTIASQLTIAGGPTWRFPSDVVLQFGGARDSAVSGPVVLVTGTPDTSAVGALPVTGAMVIAVQPLTQQGVNVISSLARRGPLAVLAVQSLTDSNWRSHGVRRSAPALRTSWAEDRPPVLLTREQTAAPVLAAHGFHTEVLRRAAEQPLKATALADLHLRVVLRRKVLSSASAPNVVGILGGSDPRLKQEYVVFSAHMDHVGVGRPDARGDSIYNGADDDASGTTAVMELAQAFARLQPRPKRSLLFLTVSGEERGLWGSNYFTAHPPVPIGQMVADLNSDMVGRNWKDTIVVIGRQHSDLGETLARVNAAHSDLGMTAIDDIWPEERFYFRSDHYNFARRGVPILFFFNGVHPDYHRPSDEPAKIDAEKESRIIKLIFYLGLEVANAAQRPKWNPESYKEIVEKQ